MVPTAGAQDEFLEEEVTVTQFTCDDEDHYYSNWRNNWFIQIGAGINQPFVERGKGAKASGPVVTRHNMTAVYNFGFGRWFSPYLGMRFNALGGSLHWNNPTASMPYNGWTKANHAQLNLELMWDMCNSIAGVNPNRPFSVIPFVGVGGDYLWKVRDGQQQPAAGTNVYRENGEKKTNNWTLPVTAGIQLRLRLCKYVDFFAEMRASFYGDSWNLSAFGRPVEANVAALGGFNFNIGGRGWDTYNQCDYVATIASLNGQVNDLRTQLLECGQEVAALQSQLPCPEPKVEKDYVKTPLMTSVRFLIDSYEIIPTEEVNVYNMAQWLKANPKERVTIAGYADKDTGTSEYNKTLSKQRADAVANALVNKYGIDRSRLIIKYDGSDVQPYTTNDWNRIVIFTQK